VSRDTTPLQRPRRVNFFVWHQEHLMVTNSILREFSLNRLSGDSVPDDLRLLLPHRDELANRTGIELSWAKDWAPWLDTSYLHPEEKSDSGIAANIRAMSDVCSLINFVAQDDEGQYFGFWRGQ
jgi:hypothetical protein